MTRDDTLRMARECTAPEWQDDSAEGWHMGMDIFRFASLIAAAEREACAQVCDGQHDMARTSTGAARADACAAAIRARKP